MYQAIKEEDWDLFNDPIQKVEKEKVCYNVSTVDLKNQPIEELQSIPTLVGFASDEGIRRNHGRSGAKNAPIEIRKALGKMAWHGKKDFLQDVGDEQCTGHELEKAQAEYSEIIHQLLLKKHFPIGIGGGHEVAIAGYTGIRKAFKNKSIGIINFDAHFDMKSTEDQLPNSGTSFYQIAEDCKTMNAPFNYLCLGIQGFSNTPKLFATAKANNVQWMTAESMTVQHQQELKNIIDQYIDPVDIIYVSICMDVFNEAFAPGVSAPNPLGISADIALCLLTHIFESGKVVYADIAETNPEFDIDGKTARLAATLLHHILKSHTVLK